MAVLKTAKTRNKDETKNTESYAKSINLGVIHRILHALGEQSPIKVTNLAMHSRMNHIVCKKYLRSMCILGWIEFLALSGDNLIKLTDTGIKIQTVLDSLGFT